MRWLPHTWEGAVQIVGRLLLITNNLYLRAQLRRRIRDQAQMTVSALGETATCLHGDCKAFRSGTCTDGRCRYHCRLYHCKGNA